MTEKSISNARWSVPGTELKLMPPRKRILGKEARWRLKSPLLFYLNLPLKVLPVPKPCPKPLSILVPLTFLFRWIKKKQP